MSDPDILWRGQIMAVFPDDVKTLTKLFKQRALHPDDAEMFSWFDYSGELQPDGTVKNEKLVMELRRTEKPAGLPSATEGYMPPMEPKT